MRRPTLVLRAEYGHGVGAGHLARCLALGASWRERGGDAAVVGEPLPAPWDHRAADAGIEWLPLDALPERADWFVADGYGLSSAQRDELRARGRLLVVDDCGESGPIRADLVLDQNAGSSASAYPDHATLIGTRYVLLRDAATFEDRPSDDVVRVAVIGMGGFPSPEVRTFTEQVVSRWAPVAEVIVLDGTQDTATAFAAADIAFTSAGSICWELCHAGVPMVVYAENRNQRCIASGLVAAGAAIDVGAPTEENVGAAVALLSAIEGDPTARASMAEAGRRLVDGRGAARVVARLRSALIDLQPVVVDDAALLFEWANDPGTRAGSFNSAPIEWDTHVEWLGARLRRADAWQWIARFDNEPIGLVRFDGAGDGAAEIGITIAPRWRGSGWSAAVIVAGCALLASRDGSMAVVARIKPDNRGSIAAFDAADFRRRPDENESVVMMEGPNGDR